MLPLMSKLAATILMSAASLTNPTTPRGLSFDASAYVTNSNQIRVSVEKEANVAVEILLRNSENQVIFHRSINKKDAKYAMKLNVDELADGKYELEVKSKEGSIRKQLNLSTKPVELTNRTIAMQ